MAKEAYHIAKEACFEAKQASHTAKEACCKTAAKEACHTTKEAYSKNKRGLFTQNSRGR